MENNHIEMLDEQIDPQQKNKKFVLVILSLFVLVLIGICLFALGLFDSKKTTNQSTNALDIAVTAAKDKELQEKNINFSQSDTRQIATVQGAEDYKAITGDEPVERTGTNEDLTRADYEDIASSKSTNQNRRISNKDRVNRKLQANIAVTNLQNKRLMRDDNHLFRQTKQEAEEARMEAEQKRNNLRQQELVLSQLEKANNNPNFGQAKMITVTDTNRYQKAKPFYGKNANKNNNSVNPNDPSIIAPVVGTNTTGQFWNKQTGFYNLNSTVSKQSYSGKRGIMAVIHGDAEGITIASGQEVKIRLLEPLRIVEGKNSTIIPMGTLISTVAKIGSDRLYLTVNSIYLVDAMYEVNITIYDIDGREGINVPSLLGTKNQGQYLSNLTQPISGAQYFAPSGTVAQQVGSSIAVNLAQNAIQAGSQMIRKKTRTTKVTIRSNYKIILFNNSKTANGKQQQQNDEEQSEL